MTEAGKQLKQTSILFRAVIAGMALFMLIAVVVNQANGPMAPSLNEYRTIISAALITIAFTCSIMAKYLFAKGIRDAKNSLNLLPAKLNRHRISLITYLAFAELPVMLSVISFLLTGNFVYEVYACVFLGFILVMFPSRKRVSEQLDLDGQEQIELE